MWGRVGVERFKKIEKGLRVGSLGFCLRGSGLGFGICFKGFSVG